MKKQSRKPKIVLIAAVDRNGALGAQGVLPWHCPQDLKHFRDLTTGKVLLMGRKTADSLPKALRNRVNLVLTRSGVYDRPGFIGVSNTRDINKALRDHGARELWVIGGGEIYRKYIKHASVVHLTQLNITVPNADTWFPMDELSDYHGCMVQGCIDPNVSFWVFNRDKIQSGRARDGVCIEMDLNQPSAVWVPPGLQSLMVDI